MFARTPRLLLRPGWPEDAPTVYKAINDQDIVRMLARAPWPYRLEDAVQWLESEPDPLRPSFLLYERTNKGAVLIGSAGLGMTETGQTEIGYWIGRSHWGRGFATEAGKAVMDIARSLGHRHLSSGHFVDNPASGKVLKKLGFRPTGQIEQRKTRGRESGSAPCIVYENDLATKSYTDSEVMRPLAA